MLGGYEVVHEVDSKTSIMMIESYRDQISGFTSAVDFGAGIGRVSKTVLMPKFKEVDLVEPSQVQIDQARLDLPQAHSFHTCGMQDFVYERKYDCVWIQWCALYLTDHDLLKFLVYTRDNLQTSEEKGKDGFKKSGLIFVKENVNMGRFVLDRDDNSITRTP